MFPAAKLSGMVLPSQQKGLRGPIIIAWCVLFCLSGEAFVVVCCISDLVN